MNRIITESGLIFEDESIKDGNVQKFESMTGTELSYDSFEVTLDFSEGAQLIDANDDELYTADDEPIYVGISETQFAYGQVIQYYHDDELVGKFYIETVSRIGRYEYKITAISAVGLLANSQHYGGIYQGTLFKDLVAEVIGGQIPYTIDLMVANQPMYGWLPIATRRENLHQILFAMNASIKKNGDGDVFITALSKDTAKNIPDSRIYQGGSVEYPQAKKAIALSEHAYIARTTDEGITLYNSEIAADSITTPLGSIVTGGLVLFDEPCHDLEITGANILESGVNYAVLSPTAECLLTGKRYTHTVRQVTRPEVIENVSDENKAVIENATLVSIANSESVANKMADYYDTAKKVKMDIIQGDEMTGDCVNFNDPFDEPTEGLIASLDMSISGILKSTVEVIADYDPPDIGNYYTHCDMITGSGVWQVPQGTEKVRIVLIGGGQAGHKGEDGTDGGIGASASGTTPSGGIGGVGGIGGLGGKILIKTIDVSNLSTLSISCGLGNTQGDGGNGTATTLTAGNTTYSSADGTTSSIGFIEQFSGNSFGYGGANGMQAANGGEYNYQDPEKNHPNGYDCFEWIGGTNGADAQTGNPSGSGYIIGRGGAGGGAAYGSNGGNGADGTVVENKRAYGGAGGQGANGANGASGITYGCGGQGGHGGGGGGAGGNGYTSGGAGGIGGNGGFGGNGADGCTFIYS